jgi:indolepyruvate ferredoxin oxidoreductase alpha subunit
VAVIIASSPCVLAESGPTGTPQTVRITEECTGCRECMDMFECPALVWDEDSSRVGVNRAACNKCGVCLTVCPTAAIVAEEGC